jgi:hypothetical protein
MKRAFISFLLLAGFGCICAFAQAQPIMGTITRDFVFPPVGLGSTETMQVDLVNIAPVPASATATAPSCTGTVTFANAAGTTIGTPSPFKVGSGQIQSITLSPSTANIVGARGAILASVQQTTTVPNPAPCVLLFSLATFDSTGVTHVFLGNASTSTPPVVYPEPLPH